MKRRKKLIHSLVIIVLLGCVSLSADPTRILVFGSDPADTSDEYHFIFRGILGKVPPEVFPKILDLIIKDHRAHAQSIINMLRGEVEASNPTAEKGLETEQSELSKDEKLIETLKTEANIEVIKAIIMKEASACRLGKTLSLLLQEWGTGPNEEDTQRKLNEHRYTFVSKSPLNELEALLYKSPPYPIVYIPCTVGTEEKKLLEFVAKAGQGFDYIYTCDCTLIDIGNVIKIVEELVGVLNPGGKLYISSNNAEYEWLSVVYGISKLPPESRKEVHSTTLAATVKQIDYYTLSGSERRELDSVVLWSPSVEKGWKRIPAYPAQVLRHHFQGRRSELNT